ncbi:MAG: hypothetical protein KA755_01605 [Candidatus Microthrix sp.]|nr:hypothetical protein [Candidatus Microthrix sp.]
MTSSARDLRYGRRGGRWATSENGHLDEVLATFAAARRSEGDDWPKLQNDTDRLRPSTTEEWQGLARQARARDLAGVELTALDREALEMYPNPPSGLLGPPADRVAAA